ncbi:MAG: aminotransferase class IV [Hymenobacter sp.]
MAGHRRALRARRSALHQVDFATRNAVGFLAPKLLQGAAGVALRARRPRAAAAGLAEIILYDAAGHVAEAGSAAIFWLKANVLYTPALGTGCVAGVRPRRRATGGPGGGPHYLRRAFYGDRLAERRSHFHGQCGRSAACAGVGSYGFAAPAPALPARLSVA